MSLCFLIGISIQYFTIFNVIFDICALDMNDDLVLNDVRHFWKVSLLDSYQNLACPSTNVPPILNTIEKLVRYK